MKRAKYILSFLVLALVITSYQVYQRGYFTVLNLERIERIKSKTAQSLLSEKEFTLLDIREGYEFDVSHIKGAVRFDESVIDNLDKEKPLMLYCTMGLRSNKLAKRLQKEGFKSIYELKSGLIGWSNSELPMVNSNNEVTKEVHVYNRYFKPFLRKGTPVF